jgi:hypothetical protein
MSTLPFSLSWLAPTPIQQSNRCLNACCSWRTGFRGVGTIIGQAVALATWAELRALAMTAALSAWACVLGRVAAEEAVG